MVSFVEKIPIKFLHRVGLCKLFDDTCLNVVAQFVIFC